MSCGLLSRSAPRRSELAFHVPFDLSNAFTDVKIAGGGVVLLGSCSDNGARASQGEVSFWQLEMDEEASGVGDYLGIFHFFQI